VIPPVFVERLRRDGAVTIELKVIPKSSKNEVAGLLGNGALKVKITAAPEKGKANAAICAFLAEEFGVPKKNVRIMRGETSPLKQVVVEL
jgi:uncharacterized protein (TIGR00251 family)